MQTRLVQLAPMLLLVGAAAGAMLPEGDGHKMDPVDEQQHNRFQQYLRYRSGDKPFLTQVKQEQQL